MKTTKKIVGKKKWEGARRWKDTERKLKTFLNNLFCFYLSSSFPFLALVALRILLFFISLFVVILMLIISQKKKKEKRRSRRKICWTSYDIIYINCSERVVGWWWCFSICFCLMWLLRCERRKHENGEKNRRQIEDHIS